MSDELPITHDELRDLFEFLDRTRQTGYECDHKYSITEKFLRMRNVPVQPMLTWLGENGAGCDCEVMFNTAPQWEEIVGYIPPDEDA